MRWPPCSRAARTRNARVDALLGVDDTGLTRSELEDLFRAFIRRHRLPMPELNARLPESGREVDALYRAQRLIIEIDSRERHDDPVAFERDRVTDADALEQRYRTVRATSRRLRLEGAQEAARIRRLLAQPW